MHLLTQVDDQVLAIGLVALMIRQHFRLCESTIKMHSNFLWEDEALFGFAQNL
jgi:hypothetical protein